MKWSDAALRAWRTRPKWEQQQEQREAIAPERRRTSTDSIGWFSGKARLSYRRAEEIWKAASGGYTLHQLRHSRLIHLAAAGEDVTMIKAKSRHRSLRSLEWYVNPGPAAIRELTKMP